ncbi:MAG TPA: aspartate carbamoyltransferase catalytic subunit [Candidatus Polarisedimenticolia bacterium]|nr:aspartate carbamoyltransferase catalytic subunit [Candidatus Polarisedimenticolia bacterium]
MIQRLPHLLGIESLTREQVVFLLDQAKPFQEFQRHPLKKLATLRGKTIAVAFFEASTRTRISFTTAAARLGADTMALQAESSSLKKGESLIDTVRTLEAMRPDGIVIRHAASGAPEFVASRLEVPVINAGDGMHEHPTQALLDALTIRDRKGKLGDWNVAILGDILHSRVARSNIHLLGKFGARITLCGPAMWVPRELEELAPNLRRTVCVEEALDGADVIMVLRVQTERIHEPALAPEEYVLRYQLTEKRLRLARPDALVLHPGPMIRGLEIDSAVADGPQSAVLEQVTNGLAVRMALLYHLIGGPTAESPDPAKDRTNASD